MSDLEPRVRDLERQVGELTAALRQMESMLALVGDVQTYTHLRDLLLAGDLDGADRETARLMFEQLVNANGDVSPEALERCPAAVVLIIDELWSGSCQGRQGFGVQQRIYRDLGGTRESLVAQDTELFEQFTRAVAWPTVADVGFALPEELTVPVPAALDAHGSPPAGHLPMRCWAGDYGLKAANLLMARLIDVFGS
jgi:hypothetical protein